MYSVHMPGLHSKHPLSTKSTPSQSILIYTSKWAMNASAISQQSLHPLHAPCAHTHTHRQTREASLTKNVHPFVIIHCRITNDNDDNMVKENYFNGQQATQGHWCIWFLFIWTLHSSVFNHLMCNAQMNCVRNLFDRLTTCKRNRVETTWQHLWQYTQRKHRCRRMEMF